MGVGTIMVRLTNNQLQDLPRGSTTTVCRVSSRNFILETSPAPPPTHLDEILVCPLFFTIIHCLFLLKLPVTFLLGSYFPIPPLSHSKYITASSITNMIDCFC